MVYGSFQAHIQYPKGPYMKCACSYRGRLGYLKMCAQLKDLISNSDVILCVGEGGGHKRPKQCVPTSMYDP